MMEFLGIDFDLGVMTVLFFAGFILAILSNYVFGPDGRVSPEVIKHVQSVVSFSHDPHGKSNQ